MTRIGFIDYYLDEWHANNYPRMIAEASSGEMVVSGAYGMIDSPLGGLTTAAWCEKMNIPRFDSIEALIAASDALIVLSPDNCEMHETLCRLPLASGKPTYVDKTFAPDGETARRIFALADAAGTPCCSTSALRFAAEYAQIDPAAVRAVSSWGPNGFETYAIHQLEPIMMLIRSRPVRVLAQKTDGCAQLNIAFEDGRFAALNCFAHGSPFLMNVSLDSKTETIEVKSDYFGAFIRALVRFFRTKRVEIPHEETVAIMDVRGAGVKALERPGEWVEI